MVQLNHEVTEREFALIPNGKYRATITSAEKLQSKANSQNHYLELVIEIDSQSSRIWDRLNLWNKNVNAVNASVSRLNQIASALGLQRVGDSDEILHKQIGVEVGIDKGNNGYADKNNITKYFSAKDSDAPPARESAPVQPPPPAPAQPSSDEPDWLAG
jgi:hypothetical protein